MSNKAKGSKTERELFQVFVDNHYRAVRVAGSGTMENADCDIIAGKKGGGRKYCIEAKSCKKLPKYISKDQIDRFMTFSEIFGLKPVIAVRVNRIGWFFINPKDMEDSGKNWVVNETIVRKKGLRFSQFFSEKLIGKNKDNNEKDNEGGIDKSLKINKDILLDEKELDSLTSVDY